MSRNTTLSTYVGYCDNDGLMIRGGGSSGDRLQAVLLVTSQINITRAVTSLSSLPHPSPSPHRPTTLPPPNLGCSRCIYHAELTAVQNLAAQSTRSALLPETRGRLCTLQAHRLGLITVALHETNQWLLTVTNVVL